MARKSKGPWWWEARTFKFYRIHLEAFGKAHPTVNEPEASATE
ncbi:MAG: hypothetical protein ACYC3I_19325 [Gemmataceae bacterium]